MINELTQKENEVLKLLSQGLSNQAIADTLHVIVRTVYARISGIYDKILPYNDPLKNKRVLATLMYLESERG